jgi:hypothetical protein
MKILPVGAELFHADRGAGKETDLKNLIVPFRNFANVSKNNAFENKEEMCTVLMSIDISSLLLLDVCSQGTTLYFISNYCNKK